MRTIKTKEKRTSHRLGTGTITFPGSDLDPTHTVPVGRIQELARGNGTYVMDASRQVALGGDREIYTPYVFGRSYDFALPPQDQINQILKEYDIIG